ncbi:MAG: Crp/Fnr family transcriptional regulator [Chloroflexi bacterium]|nr:Crp/Fnr family transcriptional regulator [Chloroflexota bacterium]
MKPDFDNLLTFLRGVQLFTELDESALVILARVSYIKCIPKGSILFCQNDDAEAAYVVRSGAINIVLCTVDGRELVINEMRPGDCFGELALLTGAPRSASAVASMGSELIVIPRQAFLCELERAPKLMQHLMATLAERLRASSQRESALAFLDAPARLASVLGELDHAAHKDGTLTISQEELAQRIGATRQTTTKILGQWRRKGWIITGRGRIMVLDRNALKKIIGG